MMEERRRIRPLRSRLNSLFAGPQSAVPRIEVDNAEVEKDVFEIAEDVSMHERWQVALAGRKAVDCKVENLRKLVDKGTPLMQRHNLWPRWWGRPKQGEWEEFQSAGATTEFASQIELDLRRTLPSNCTDNQCDALRRVLCAYAAFNPSIGYCQGMSFIAAVPLLLAFSEADAFMGLRYVVEEVCPDYHCASLGGYFRDAAVLDALLSQLLPEVHSALVDLDIPFDMIATDHLLTVSSRSWPLQAVARLWDVVLMEGSPALLASFLALLQTYFPKALANAKAAGLQADEIPTDVARRFLQMSRKGISKDIDKVMHRTRKFLPLLLGDLSAGSNGKDGFLQKLRAQFSDLAAGPDPDESNKGASAPASPSEVGDSAGTRVAADDSSAPAEMQADGNPNEAATGEAEMAHSEEPMEDAPPLQLEHHLEILVEAQIRVNASRTRLLRVGVIEHPRDVAQRFVRENGLDASCVGPLVAWLKRVEDEAFKYPVKAEGDIATICGRAS